MIQILIPNPNAADGATVTSGGGSGGQVIRGTTDVPSSPPADPTLPAIYYGPNGTVYTWDTAAQDWIANIS